MSSFSKSSAEGYDALSFCVVAEIADQARGAAAWTWGGRKWRQKWALIH